MSNKFDMLERPLLERLIEGAHNSSQVKCECDAGEVYANLKPNLPENTYRVDMVMSIETGNGHRTRYHVELCAPVQLEEIAGKMAILNQVDPTVRQVVVVRDNRKSGRTAEKCRLLAKRLHAVMLWMNWGSKETPKLVGC